MTFHRQADNSEERLPGDYVFISNIDIADGYPSIEHTKNIIILGTFLITHV